MTKSLVGWEENDGGGWNVPGNLNAESFTQNGEALETGLPVPTGTAEAGNVPIATGEGNESVWGAPESGYTRNMWVGTSDAIPFGEPGLEIPVMFISITSEGDAVTWGDGGQPNFYFHEVGNYVFSTGVRCAAGGATHDSGKILFYSNASSSMAAGLRYSVGVSGNMDSDDVFKQGGIGRVSAGSDTAFMNFLFTHDFMDTMDATLFVTVVIEKVA